ncbi:hypothetical protein, partial [Acinetobacter baumannii]
MTAQMKTNASAKKAVNSPSHIYDTFIVGAGISGIAAAIRLDQVGYTNYKRHCCKVSDEAAFCLIQRPYISKTLL